MELWQVVYVIGVFAGLLVGGATNPYLAVVFIWVFIIVGEGLHYWAESKRFEKAVEEAEERAETTP